MKPLRLSLIVFIYGLFLLEILWISSNIHKCSFANCIEKISLENFVEIVDEYEYSFNEVFVDEEDLYHLAHISGTIVQENGEKIQLKLLLMSSEDIYKIKLASFDKQDKNNMNLENEYVTFLAKFPVNDIEPGDYKIGFIFKEQNNTTVLWTNQSIGITI